jgi:simple sugar transport system permease protein
VVNKKHSELFILALVLVLAFLLMWALSPAKFLQLGNFQSMAFQLPELGLLSVAMMITMLTGGINLSIIASANLSGIVTAIVLKRFIEPDAIASSPAGVILLAICAGLATSFLIGLVNGLLIAVVDVSPILATLGMMTLVNGLTIVLTKGYVIAGFPVFIRFLGNGLVLGIPMPIIIFFAVVAVISVLLNRTPLGFAMHMIGSNATASYFSGVNNRAVLIKTYVVSGLCTGIASLIMISRFNSVATGYGSSYLLITILACVLGGTSTVGGFGRISGLVLALLILQFIASGLNLLRVSAFLTNAIWGFTIILVMVVNFYGRSFQEKAGHR